MNEQRIIKLENISAGYDGKLVLKNVSLDIFDHDFLGVIGPNGGGKTTLLHVILGMIRPLSGSVSYYRNGALTPHISIGYLPQYNDIDRRFPISVAEVVLSGLSKQKSLLKAFTHVPMWWCSMNPIPILISSFRNKCTKCSIPLIKIVLWLLLVMI